MARHPQLGAKDGGAEGIRTPAPHNVIVKLCFVNKGFY